MYMITGMKHGQMPGRVFSNILKCSIIEPEGIQHWDINLQYHLNWKLWQPNLTLCPLNRGKSIPIVKDKIDENFFKITLTSIIRHLCDKKPDEIMSYQDSLEETIRYKKLWTNDVREDIAKIVEWMLDLNYSEEIHNYGRKLLGKLDEIPKDYVKDITVKLTIIAKSSASESDKEATTNLLNELKEKLDKKIIENYYNEGRELKEDK